MSFFSLLPSFSLELFGTARVAVLRDDDPLCRFSSVALQCANYHRVPLTGIYNTYIYVHALAHAHRHTRTWRARARIHAYTRLTCIYLRAHQSVHALSVSPHNRQSSLVCLAILVAFFWFLVSSLDKDGFLPHSYSPPPTRRDLVSFFRRLKYHCSYTWDVFGDAT